MPPAGSRKKVVKKNTEKEESSENDVETKTDFPTFLPAKSDTSSVEPPKRKRGRKPKGGKIISTDSLPNQLDENNRPNVILHLKCYLKDLDDSILSTSLIAEAGKSENITAYSSYETRSGDLEYQVIDKPEVQQETFEEIDNKTLDGTSRINAKLKELSRCLHSNDISDKKSACFWCTCEFDNPPISIPQYELNGTYHVYGCFCSPECAVAHLMEQRIDQSMKFERYALLNHLYCKLYQYEHNIRPAPNPYYTLDKYYGNLTIQEYRKLLKSERLLLIVDKPLTRILPELHQDSGDQMFGASKSSSNPNQPKYRLKRKNTQVNKKTVVNNTFGISS